MPSGFPFQQNTQLASKNPYRWHKKYSCTCELLWTFCCQHTTVAPVSQPNMRHQFNSVTGAEYPVCFHRHCSAGSKFNWLKWLIMDSVWLCLINIKAQISKGTWCKSIRRHVSKRFRSGAESWHVDLSGHAGLNLCQPGSTLTGVWFKNLYKVRERNSYYLKRGYRTMLYCDDSNLLA